MCDLKLDDDLLLEHSEPDRGPLQFALYAAHLASGHTLKGQYIKAATIRAYLRAAATFLFRYTGVDPRYDRPGDKAMSHLIRAILDEVERFEKMPNKTEPYTTKLQHRLEELNSLHAVHDDSLWATLEDWFSGNLQTGCRLSEWAQHQDAVFPKKFALGRDGAARAFTPADVFCKDGGGAFVSLSHFLAHPDSVDRLDLIWSHQKNGNDGEKRMFTRNRKNPRRCFIRRFHSILCRFDRLVGIEHTHLPLAVYKDKNDAIRFVTETEITKVMRALAVDVYKYKKSDRILYSSHSLRVGACVMLHARGFSTDQIKFLLPWKSNAFMEYLRNIALLCDKQNEAVNVFDQMPNLV